MKSAGPDVSNDPTPADNSASAVTQLSYARAQLRVTKTPSFRRVNARAAVRYRIRVQALGSVAGVGVRVCDRLDPYLTVISAPHARFSAGSPCWTLPRLDPGHPRVFTIRVVADNVPRARHAPDGFGRSRRINFRGLRRAAANSPGPGHVARTRAFSVASWSSLRTPCAGVRARRCASLMHRN